MTFKAAKATVLNRGAAPDSFLWALVEWAKTAPDEIFAPNDNPADVYALVKTALGPWESLNHRRAVMLEVMRVHAGFESSWNWREGVDKANKSSQKNIHREESGILQVSFDSLDLGGGALRQFAREFDIATPRKFIDAMKNQHKLALEYYARLVRISIEWAGPLKSGKILPLLSRAAVAEFLAVLSA